MLFSTAKQELRFFLMFDIGMRTAQYLLANTIVCQKYSSNNKEYSRKCQCSFFYPSLPTVIPMFQVLTVMYIFI